MSVALEPTAPRLEARVDLLPEGRIRGYLSWPGNTLFRPSIGIFLQGRFRRSAPARFSDFVIDGGAGMVRWGFDIACPEASAARQGAELHVTCLELGRVLLHRPGRSGAAQPPPGIIGLDQLMAEARALMLPTPTDGFAEFLRLPVIDQIEILYTDILGRGVDELGLYARAEAIRANRITILDVRDELMGSDELRDRRVPTPDERVGHWCCWSGLRDLAPHVLVPRDLAGGAAEGDSVVFACHLQSFETTTALERHLLRLIGAEDADRIARSRWLLRHGALIAGFATPRLARAAATPPERARVLPLLAAMSVGPAGERDDSGIRSRPGPAGVLAFGPYLRLETGTYLLNLAVSAEPAPEALLLAEVVAGDIVFANAAWPLAEIGAGRAGCLFHIPPEFAQLLRNVRYETRFSLRGEATLCLSSVQIQKAAEDEPPDYPAVTDWLPFMTLGPGSLRQPDGSVVAPAGAPPGHMVYGPYVSLLPGQYEVSADFQQADARSTEVVLEVVGRDPVPLARQVFQVAGPRCRARLAFAVPPADDPAGLPRGLEFRITRLAGSGALRLECLHVGPAFGLAASGEVAAAVAAPAPGLRRLLGRVMGGRG
jgi:hypothetical protein